MDKVRLGDVCTVVSGSTPKTGVPEFWDGDIDWITPAELTDETYIITESARKITEEAVKKTGLKSFPAGTVILSSRAPIGKVAIAGKEMYCNQGFKNLICSDRINAYFLFWFLRGNTEYLNSLGRGATFKEISKSIVENIKIQLPSMPEQIRCAETLKQVWDVVALRRQQLTALDTLIKARFVELFGEPEANTKNWPVVNMADLCTVGSSKRIYQSEQSMDGVPFWRISDLTNLISTGMATAELFIPEERYMMLQAQKQVPVEGDILVTSRGTLGQCYIVRADDKFYFQDGMISWLSEYADGITPLYIAYLFSMPGFRKQIDSMQAGSTVAYLSIAMIRKLKVMLPDMETQNQFSAFVAQVDKSKAVVQAAHVIARNLHSRRKQKCRILNF